MDKDDVIYYLIDACSNLAGTTVHEVYERGELGYYTAIIEEQVSPSEVSMYELDIITELMEDWPEDQIVDEFTRALRHLTGQYEQ